MRDEKAPWSTRIRAAEILLKKAVPDLASIDGTFTAEQTTTSSPTAP
jgi:hypothetical protein